MRSLIAWLNRRFPERVTVTLANYQALCSKIEEFERLDGSLRDVEARVSKAEANLSQLNVINGFTAQGKQFGRLER